MRKFWRLGMLCMMLTLLFTLAACSNSTKGEPAATTKEQPATNLNNEGSGNEGLAQYNQEKAYAQYYEVMDSLLQHYPIAMDQYNFDDEEASAAILYTELIDFDGDGLEELYLLIRGRMDDENEFNENSFDGFIHMVWRAGETTAKRIFYEEVLSGDCEACNNALALSKLEGLTIINKYNYQSIEDDAVMTNYYYAFTTNGYETTVLRELLIDDVSTYYVDDEELDIDQFSSYESALVGEITFLLPSGDQFNTTNEYDFGSAKLISKVLEKIQANNNNVAKSATKVDPSTIQAEAEMLMGIDFVDVNNKDMYQHMFEGLFYQRKVEADVDNLEGYMGFSEEKVSQVFEETYGVPLDTSALVYPDVEMQTFESFAYQDGVFYRVPVEDTQPIYRRTVEEAYQIGEDLYYLKVKDLLFDAMRYFSKEERDDWKEFVDHDVGDWPYEAWPYMQSNLTRYIVLKMDGNEPTFRYIGYRNLTDDEIESY